MTDTTFTKIIAVLACIIVVGGTLLVAASAADDETESKDCAYEDVLPFELQEDAYDLKAGHVICIHIDQVNDAPSPEDLQAEREVQGG